MPGHPCLNNNKELSKTLSGLPNHGCQMFSIITLFLHYWVCQCFIYLDKLLSMSLTFGEIVYSRQ